MNTNELKAERVRKGISIPEMADALGIGRDTYSRKERGLTEFSPDQISTIAYKLEMDIKKLNLIFFDNKLPIGKSGLSEKVS